MKAARLVIVVLCMALVAVRGSLAATATNVILFIGDGMGFEQIRAGAYFIGTNLAFESWPHQGTVQTHSAGGAITDSAAAGTAIAAGHKANNGVVSVAIPGDGSRYETVLELMQRRRGKRVGLVTTSYITDATPAVFAAHAAHRSQYIQIGACYLNESRPNVLFGGTTGYSGAQAAATGYTVVTNRAALQALDTSSETRVAGMFGSGKMPYEHDGVGDLPHLSEMTQVALDILSHATNGFFLMVEGARIDHACHANSITNCVREVGEFDNAIRVGLSWASNRTDTLLIVTADHETGGLQVLTNNGPGVEPTVSWSTLYHSAADVGIYAMGPGAERLTGEMDNTYIYKAMVWSQELEPGSRAMGLGEAGGVEITWDAVPDSTCIVERTASLIETNWVPIATVTAGTHVLKLSDPTVTNMPNAFYRLTSAP